MIARRLGGEAGFMLRFPRRRSRHRKYSAAMGIAQIRNQGHWLWRALSVAGGRLAACDDDDAARRVAVHIAPGDLPAPARREAEQVNPAWRALQ